MPTSITLSAQSGPNFLDVAAPTIESLLALFPAASGDEG
jgi:hypothetical protein